MSESVGLYPAILNGLYSASSQVHSPLNIRLSRRVSGAAPDNSQLASDGAGDVSIMWVVGEKRQQQVSHFYSTRPTKMSTNWRDDEIRELLSVRADAGIVRQIHGTARDSVVYDQITKRLHERGIFRAKAQVNNKLKALKRQYNQLVEQSGNERPTWCYFSLCEAVWGSSGSGNPVAVVGSMETDSTSMSPETPYSDTEEKPRVYETDVSINDSGELRRTQVL